MRACSFLFDDDVSPFLQKPWSIGSPPDSCVHAILVALIGITGSWRAPYTDSYTPWVQVWRRSVYDQVKILVRSLSSRVPGHLTTLHRRVPASKKATSLPEASVLSSSSAGGYELLVIHTISGCSVMCMPSSVINRLKRGPLRLRPLASISMASGVQGWDICSYTNSTIWGGLEYDIMASQCSQLEAELAAWEFVGWIFLVADHYNRL